MWIVSQKTGTKKECNCQGDVNARRDIVDCLADTGNTVSIIPTHLVKKYNLIPTRAIIGILAKQSKATLTLRKKWSFEFNNRKCY